MLNMEPQQLSQLLIQQSVLFESVFEGLIAIDSDYKITAINQTARRLLNLSQPEPTLIGKRISSVISQEVFFYDAPQTNKKTRSLLQSDQSDRQPDGGDLKQ
ncbi:signal transduction histidine kinase regulating citrate/malate metabolism [Klebsiella pneumoniae]|uniref:Signal transduction histidine kinase regulating citrate/malate metabolism n=1 Tax=Klebsiella pneumoniae TaxID=573 RepID=A0A377WD46_KLEPN|nr:signal transduction histidine kinase regulating citrate/malate metabolism [Klebsiella pneumoniae]